MGVKIFDKPIIHFIFQMKISSILQNDQSDDDLIEDGVNGVSQSFNSDYIWDDYDMEAYLGNLTVDFDCETYFCCSCCFHPPKCCECCYIPHRFLNCISCTPTCGIGRIFACIIILIGNIFNTFNELPLLTAYIASIVSLVISYFDETPIIRTTTIAIFSFLWLLIFLRILHLWPTTLEQYLITGDVTTRKIQYLNHMIVHTPIGSSLESDFPSLCNLLKNIKLREWFMDEDLRAKFTLHFNIFNYRTFEGDNRTFLLNDLYKNCPEKIQIKPPQINQQNFFQPLIRVSMQGNQQSQPLPMPYQQSSNAYYSYIPNLIQLSPYSQNSFQNSA